MLAKKDKTMNYEHTYTLIADSEIYYYLFHRKVTYFDKIATIIDVITSETSDVWQYLKFLEHRLLPTTIVRLSFICLICCLFYAIARSLTLSIK